MKSARWFTGAGSFVLFASAIFHGTGYFPLVKRIEAKAVPYPLGGILKSTWLTFSVQLIVLALIAFLASRSERGGWIVLLCAASTGLTSLILLGFLGPFLGFYLTSVVFLLSSSADGCKRDRRLTPEAVASQIVGCTSLGIAGKLVLLPEFRCSPEKEGSRS